MYLLVCMKNIAAVPGFLSTAYLGQVERRKGGLIFLKNVVQVLEMIDQSQRGSAEIKTSYVANSKFTNGVLGIKEEDIFAEREVQADDEFLKGYNNALEAMRLSKSNLQRASQMPAGPQPSDFRGRN